MTEGEPGVVNDEEPTGVRRVDDAGPGAAADGSDGGAAADRADGAVAVTGPEQHAATVREALDAMMRMDAQIETNTEHGTPDWYVSAQFGALAALDELVALAGRADELEAGREQLLAARENAYERLGRAMRQREDAEARVISVSEYGRKRAEAAEARADEQEARADANLEDGLQARREADQLRAALYNHGYGPDLCRCEWCAALAGVQADSKDSA